MPSCPKCGITLGMWERGLLCPNCHLIFSFDEASSFEGFDWNQIALNIDLMQTLEAAGLLGFGANSVEFFEDGMIVTRLDDIY